MSSVRTECYAIGFNENSVSSVNENLKHRPDMNFAFV
jgi:hypothetical protein